jgi:hypothetical protein
MSQTSYPLVQAAALAGLLYGTDNHAKSALNQEATTLPFGIGVAQGTADDAAKLPASSSDKIAGIVIRVAGQNQLGLGGTNTGVLTADRMSILEDGKCWVQVEEAVTPASPVYCRYATGSGGSQKGAFRASADTTTAALVKGARYETSAGIAGFAVLAFDKIAANT